MWKTLASVVVGRSILLTTHSMEEAGALANRAGIMAKRMLAMGTTEYLRHKHGAAYHCHLVTKTAPHTTEEETSRIRDWILERFPKADLEPKTYHGQLRFSVPASEVLKPERPVAVDVDEISGGPELSRIDGGVGSLLALFEDHKEELGLAHYAVVSLDFISNKHISDGVIESHNFGPSLLEHCREAQRRGGELRRKEFEKALELFPPEGIYKDRRASG